jgi:nicotinamidase/pyrazinamidase
MVNGFLNVAMAPKVSLSTSDALLIADIQNDFMPGGALGIRGCEEILPVLENYIRRFHVRSLPIFLTRDWHPSDHCSFVPQGGVWPVHCVAGASGSLPPPSFPTPDSAVIICKATDRNQEAYSAFQHTSLDRQLRDLCVRRLFIGGLATDYCVLNSVKDARTRGYDVCLLMDGIRPVDLRPDDGRRAVEEMIGLGAAPIRLEMLEA